MDNYEIEVAITLRLLSADGTEPMAMRPQQVTISGRLGALQLIVANQGWKGAIAETAMRLLVEERKANE